MQMQKHPKHLLRQSYITRTTQRTRANLVFCSLSCWGGGGDNVMKKFITKREKMGLSATIICPRSSYLSYVVTYYIIWKLLLGQTVPTLLHT